MKRPIILLVFMFLLSYGANAQNEKVIERNRKSNNKNIECFEAAWKRVKDVYPFLEFKKINWDSIYTVYRPGIGTANGKEFDHLLNDMLAELKDVHVYYSKENGNQKYVYNSPRQIKDLHAISKKVIGKYFSEKLKMPKSKSVLYGMTPDNIGYIYFNNFYDNGIENEFYDIVKSLGDTKGLIIDVRTPTGGAYSVTKEIIRCFLATPLEKPELYFLGEEIEQPPFQPSTDSFVYNKPIVVLIYGRTISAGEGVAEMLKQLPNVTAIGDTTSGGGGAASGHTPLAVGPYSLPCKKSIFIPTGYFLRYDGSHIEWNGIPPDIRVAQTEADVKNGRDKQLEFAISMLK